MRGNSQSRGRGKLVPIKGKKGAKIKKEMMEGGGADRLMMP